MTIRAVLAGLLLALAIAGLTYFNDQVMNNTYLIGSHLPLIVFGTLVLLVVLVNPLLGRVGGGWRIRPSEMAVVASLALAACAWPGTGLLRQFTTTVALPAELESIEPQWQATQVFSYTPGASARIAPGQVSDFDGLVRLARGAAEQPHTPLERRLADSLSPADRLFLRTLETGGPMLDAGQRRRLLALVNAAWIDESATILDEGAVAPAAATPHLQRRDAARERLRALADPASVEGDDEEAPLRWWRTQQLALEARQAQAMANRAIVSELTQGLGPGGGPLIRPAPAGSGVIINHGRGDTPTTLALRQGWGGEGALPPWQLPWRAWWPTLRLWGGVVALLGIAGLCIVLIVHPQWSQRELITYPVAQFVGELTRASPGSAMPARMRQPAFWVAMSLVMFIHLLNGLNAWGFRSIPTVPLELDFTPARAMFPSASRVFESQVIWQPTIMPSVVAFCIFLRREVSLSLGLSAVAMVLLGAAMLRAGWAPQSSDYYPVSGSMLRFGAMTGYALMIFWFGRRYFADVAARASFLKHPGRGETPNCAVWAARLLGLTATAAAVLLVVYGGMHWPIAASLVLITLMLSVVLARVHAETGAFYLAPGLWPIAALWAVFGFQGMGPGTFVVAAIGSLILMGGAREAAMPFLVDAVYLADRQAGLRGCRIGRWLGAVMLASLAVAVVVTLWLQYNHGANAADSWATRGAPRSSFKLLAEQLGEADARGELGAITGAGPLEQLAMMRPDTTALSWAAAGLSVTLLIAIARLRLPWWPLHPVLFVLAGSWPTMLITPSFLLGWFIKMLLGKIGGARAIDRAKPFMIGIIAGELLAALGWAVAGAAWFARTGNPPPVYRVLTGG